VHGNLAHSTPVGKPPSEADGHRPPTSDTTSRPLSGLTTALAVFIALLGRGLWPIVIYPRDVTLPGGRVATGKEPIGKGWGLIRWTLERAKKLFARWKEAGVGVCLGPGRGPGGTWLGDIEGDGPEADESRARLLGGEVIETMGWGSFRGDHQLWLFDGERLQAILPRLAGCERKDKPGVYHFDAYPGVEIRIGGTKPDGTVKQIQSVCPPTPGTNGTPRQWDDVESIADAPEVFYAALEAIAEASEAKVTKAEAPQPRPAADPRANGKHQAPDVETRALKYLERCEPAVSGQNGHNKAFKAACKIGPGFDLPHETTLRLIRDHFNPRCVPPWSEKELQHKVEDAYRVEERRGWLRDADRNGHRPRAKGNGGAATINLPEAIPEDPERFRLTDLGNAERLIKLFGHRLRYCPKLGAWLVWDESRWKEDGTGEIFRLAKRTIRTIGAEVTAAASDDEAKAILRWALTSQSKARIDAMVGLAWNEPGIPVMTDELNRDPYLLNVRNGTLDLKTAELRPHRQEDLITKLAPVRYDPNAECPRFMAFLRRVLPGSKDHPDDLIQFVQRCLGYSLTASIAEHALFFLFGSGRNGKSTLLNVILHLLGDYATTIDVSLLISKHHQDHPTGLTDLDGRRFVPTSEVDEGKRIAEALAKKLTGGERIKARRMREDHYEFDPTHKLFLAVNHEPEIRGTDEGIWSRIKMIPFSVFIPKEERIKDLDKILVAEEGPGILAWLVRGCIEWQMRGLDEPKAVIDATDSYRAMMDGLGNFIDEMCECPTEEHLKGKTKTLAKPLFDCYSDWARRNGDEPMTSRRFGSEMERRGYKLDKANSKCWRLGIRIKNVAQERDNASGYF
jgi:P4 family phage/plasmid primase-like protien